MEKRLFRRFAVSLYILLTPLVSSAESEQPLYIIFDGSNSMWGVLADESRKIETAKKVFRELDDSMFENREVALRLYGHRRAKDCSDTDLAVPFTQASDTKSRLSAAINDVTPRGRTPITRSLIAALEDFGDRSGDILLISDGIETCDADPCELVESWRQQDINIRVHVVGLGLTETARGAMQCISKASGTQYMDANNLGELSKAIESTAKAAAPSGEPDPKPQEQGNEFGIIGEDENGNFLPVKGTISGTNIETQEIKSHSRYVFDGGEYTINVGVPTASGEVYKPINQNITIKDQGSTKITVKLTRPPMVTTQFLENGEEVRGVGAYAYIDDKQDHLLRYSEEHFVMPGTYEYRASLRTDNADLRVIETIVDGEDKVVVFNLIETVPTRFKIYDKRTGKLIRQHQELWQGGELKYKVHHANGAKVQPGTYTLKSHSVETPYEINDVVVPAGDNNVIEHTLEFGSVNMAYQFTRQPEKLVNRCWLYRIDENGEKSAHSGRMRQCDGQEEVSVSEGRFYIHTYYDTEETYFDIKNGETKQVTIPVLAQ